MATRRFSFRFLSRLCIYQLELLRQFKFTVLVFYDDEQPEPDTFKEFLAIPHHGELGKSSYTRLNTATTLLYDPIPADNATRILPLPETDGPLSAKSFPRNPSSEIAGVSVMNARCVAITSIREIFPHLLLERDGEMSWCPSIRETSSTLSKKKPG